MKKKEILTNINLDGYVDMDAYKVTLKSFSTRRTTLFGALLVMALPVAFLVFGHRSLSVLSVEDSEMFNLQSAPIAAADGKRGTISVPAGIKKANPFLPYRDISSTGKVVDVPSYTLVEPPEIINEGSDAARVMDTIVSGILYDKYNPSAILNIEGNDYLVKKGDVVNNYKVLNIAQDSVTVKLGSNVYKAGIGEILTEGDLNYNNVANLNKKFGGER